MSRDWNEAYRVGDTPWDKGYASPPLLDFMENRPILGRVLVTGCGTGHDVRALAAQGADVVGLDIAESALRKAKKFPRAGHERYVCDDFLDPKAIQLGAFDWLVEHTCLCALDPVHRRAYAQSVRGVLKPGGYFLAVFFREVEDYTGQGPPHPISAEAIDELFGCDFEQLESSFPKKSYPSRPYRAEEIRWMRLRAKEV
jgi:SAM-dependent methyltransferase